MFHKKIETIFMHVIRTVLRDQSYMLREVSRFVLCCFSRGYHGATVWVKMAKETKKSTKQWISQQPQGIVGCSLEYRLTRAIPPLIIDLNVGTFEGDSSWHFWWYQCSRFTRQVCHKSQIYPWNYSERWISQQPRGLLGRPFVCGLITHVTYSDI